MRRPISASLVAVCIIMSLTACSTGGSSTGDRLSVRIGADISNLDPATINQIENQTLAANIYNGLVKYQTKTNELVPDLAKDWKISEDGKTYTFKLREDVTWQKGYGKFTSSDVAFSLERVMNKDTASPYAGLLSNIEKIETPADNEVVINLNQPNAKFLNKVAAFNQGWIVSKKAVTKLGDKYNLDPVGTGPFQFGKWTPGSRVTLTANSDYFGNAPKVKTLVFKLIANENAASAALRSGEIDVFFALQSPNVIENLKNTDGVNVLSRKASSTLNLVMNTSRPPFDDPRVRQAFAYGVDRKGLITDYFDGSKDAAPSYMTQAFPEFTDDVQKYSFDPKKAQRLLKDAGATGAKFTLTTVGLSPYDKIVVPIADNLKQAGFSVKIRVLERAAYQQARSAGDLDVVVTSIVGPPDADALTKTLLSSASFPPGLNTARYEGIDGLLNGANREKDDAKRKEMYADIQRKVMQDLPILPLYSDRLFIAENDRVKGLQQNSLFTVQLGNVILSK